MEESIIKCPVCKGWSSKEIPLKRQYTTCGFCKGESVQLYSQDYYVTWDIPSFINYGQRRTNSIKKIMFVFVPLVAGTILVITLINLMIKSFT